MRRRAWSYAWDHPSGDGSWGQVPGLHRTARSAERAVYNKLVNDYPSSQGHPPPPISRERFHEGTLDVRLDR